MRGSQRDVSASDQIQHAVTPEVGAELVADQRTGQECTSGGDAQSAASDAQRRGKLLAAAERLQLPLSGVDADRLMAFLSLLQRWNRVYNLTALRDPNEMLSHHLVDCLAVLPALRRHAATGSGLRVLDVGSGGGLPGVVLAILQPDWQISCVDTVSKKASFIRQAGAELRLPNLAALHSRVEDLPADKGFDLITSRAFASLADFTALTAHLLSPGGTWAAMKAKLTPQELAAVPADVDMFHVEQIAVPALDAQRCLVWMRPRGG